MPSALVILREELPVGPREFAPGLARLLGTVAYDVVSAFNRSRVIPFESLSEDRAAAAAEFLADSGIEAAAVDAATLPPVPRVFWVRNADVEEGGLSVQTDLVGKMQKLPWDGVLALSAASLSTTRGMTGMRGTSTGAEVQRAVGRMMVIGPGGLGMKGRVRRRARPKMKQRTESYELIALAPREAPIEMRFRADQFNYDYLGERLTASVDRNFRLFAGDLLARAGDALVSPGLRALAEEKKRPPAMATDEFVSYNRWLRLRAGGSL